VIKKKPASSAAIIFLRKDMEKTGGSKHRLTKERGDPETFGGERRGASFQKKMGASSWTRGLGPVQGPWVGAEWIWLSRELGSRSDGKDPRHVQIGERKSGQLLY